MARAAEGAIRRQLKASHKVRDLAVLLNRGGYADDWCSQVAARRIGVSAHASMPGWSTNGSARSTWSQRPTEPYRRQALKRFHHFRDLVEQHFAGWKSISLYAAEMGCTQKSLTRAVLDAEGISAKAFVLKRLGLEAKRLLVHTDWPVGVIADQLGFEEATHFSKFFRRLAGCTPSQFRFANGWE